MNIELSSVKDTVGCRRCVQTSLRCNAWRVDLAQSASSQLYSSFQNTFHCFQSHPVPKLRYGILNLELNMFDNLLNGIPHAGPLFDNEAGSLADPQERQVLFAALDSFQ